MRGVSPLWRSFVLVAALSLIPSAAFAQDLTENRTGGPPSIAAQGRLSIPPGAPAEDEEQSRIGLPPGAPAEETLSLWTWLMTWFLYS
jgi:hypothetical protein